MDKNQNTETVYVYDKEVLFSKHGLLTSVTSPRSEKYRIEWEVRRWEGGSLLTISQSFKPEMKNPY